MWCQCWARALLSPQAITGKFLPLDQWFYFDALECLAVEGAARLMPEDCAPVSGRCRWVPRCRAHPH